jgi:hypothetical protein
MIILHCDICGATILDTDPKDFSNPYFWDELESFKHLCPKHHKRFLELENVFADIIKKYNSQISDLEQKRTKEIYILAQ